MRVHCTRMPSSGVFCSSLSSFANLLRAAPDGPLVPYTKDFNGHWRQMTVLFARLGWALSTSKSIAALGLLRRGVGAWDKQWMCKSVNLWPSVLGQRCFISANLPRDYEWKILFQRQVAKSRGDGERGGCRLGHNHWELGLKLLRASPISSE